jgi:hypothetical protein
MEGSPRNTWNKKVSQEGINILIHRQRYSKFSIGDTWVSQSPTEIPFADPLFPCTRGSMATPLKAGGGYRAPLFPTNPLRG